MAGKTAVLSLKIIGDATSAQRAAATTKKELSTLDKALAGVNKAAKWAGAAAGAALALGMHEAIERDSANMAAAASMGLDPKETEEFGRITGDAYNAGLGESMEQVRETVRGVGSTLADISANGGADVERLTEKALAMAQAFPEVGDGVATAGILIHTGLAKSADEAYDLMVGSMQKMPAAMQAELMPVMDEYAQHFAALGINGETAFGIMTQAANDGAIGMDKTGDALKELTIRATDGSATTVAAYEAMGLGGVDMAAKMLAGGEEASEAFGMIVAGLQGIEDPVAQSQAALALFGTPLEDLGTSKIPDFLGAIDPMGDAFDSTAGAADRLAESVNSGPAVALESFKRTAVSAFTDLAANALPVIEPVIGKLQEFAPVIAPIVLALAGFAGIVWAVNAAMTAWTAIQAVAKGVMAAATAAQWLFNAAMTANPIGVVIALIAALVAGVILAYNNIGWFKDAVNLAGRVAAAAFQTVISWVQNAISWVKSITVENDRFMAVVRLVGSIAAAAFGAVTSAVQGAINWVKSITTENDRFMGAMRGLSGVASSVFGGINSAIQGTIGWVKDAIGWFKGLFGAKNDAASVDAGAGAAAAMAMPAVAAYRMAAMPVYGPPMLDAQPAEYAGGWKPAPAATFASAAAPLLNRIGTLGAAAERATVHNEFNVEITAGIGDPVAIGREVDRVLTKYRKTVGGTR